MRTSTPLCTAIACAQVFQYARRVSEKWVNYVQRHRGSDTNAEMARKLGFAGSTITRWMDHSSTPKAKMAARFARVYKRNPLEALVAAEILDQEDIGDEVTIDTSSDLDDYSTDELMTELSKRLETMGEYVGWIRSIATGETPLARLGLDTLRYVDPFTRPSDVDALHFVTPLELVVSIDETQTDRGNVLQFTPPKPDVGGPAQDELDEAAGESNIRHEEDEDDYHS